MNNMASKLQQRRPNLLRVLKNQAPESLILGILESDIGIRESAKVLHTRNWKLQLKEDAEEVLKDKAEAWLKDPTTKPKQTNEACASRLVGERQLKARKCEKIAVEPSQ